MSISAVAHLVVALVVDIDPPERTAGPVAVTTVEIVQSVRPPEPPPMDVRLLDEAPTTPAVQAPASKRAVVPRAAPRVATSRGTTGGAGTATTEVPGPPSTGTEPGTRSKYFDMRRGGRADLTLPATHDALDHAPAGTAPQAGVAPSGQLESAAGGRKKSNQDVFVAKVERDGSVRLMDTKNLQVKLSWNPAELLSGRFDVTDYLMRKTKNDPYASRKLKFLDETRAERVEIGKAWRKEQLKQTSIIMKQNLARAWNASADMTARKRALFELWDEIVEPKTREDQADEVLAEASRAARSAVIGFIRAHLPAGSAHAYSEAELAAFNAAKQSAMPFVPYE